MAVRPLVTTGVALLSAGALVAGTPALFVPRDEVTVASSAMEAPSHRKLTAEQINLLSLSLEGVVDSFLNGYGGFANPGVVIAPTAGYILNDKGQLAYPGENTPDDALLYDLDKLALYKKVDGQLVRATVGDMGSNVQFYDAAGNEANEWVEDPGNCAAEGAVCQDGFTGLAYYVTDNLLPFGDLDNVFWESGLVPFFQVAAEIGPALIDSVPGLERLQLTKRVDEFFAGGAAYVAYSIINDNLPDDALGEWAKGLNATFYTDGVTGVVKYIVETVKVLTEPQEPDADSVSLLSAVEKTEAAPETETGVTSTTLPDVSKLLSLPTPKVDVESPLKKLAERLGAPAESTPVNTLEVKEEGTADDTIVDGVTAPAAPAAEAPTPTAPKFELPKLPKLDLNLTPKVEEKAAEEVKEPAAEEKSEDAGAGETGAASGTGHKFEPRSRATERKKTAGQKFVENATKNLEKAFKPTTKAGPSKHETAKRDGDSGTGSSTGGSAATGSAASDKDSGDAKGKKDK
ncbi:hypothetical protein K1X22_02865 [Mycolicibacterium farcinogenes]|uniref:hypothetical protein n=1 Tax=Mycolicibacterium farcinogenes TaxID=1802 RepID=UPI001C8EC8C0|nr:hypothetical protein [Mycolicibacterium farcinogenes]QZH60764.1 hypothetical protein K1X22_02865 [Mycolicibacterium farcinogenes]